MEKLKIKVKNDEAKFKNDKQVSVFNFTSPIRSRTSFDFYILLLTS